MLNLTGRENFVPAALLQSLRKVGKSFTSQTICMRVITTVFGVFAGHAAPQKSCGRTVIREHGRNVILSSTKAGF